MRKLRVINQKFKNYDGGVLKFEDCVSKRKRYFEMNYLSFKPIYKALKRKHWFCLVMGYDSGFDIFFSLDVLAKYFHLETSSITINTLIDDRKIAIADRDYVYKLVDQMMCPEKEEVFTEKFIGYEHLNKDYNVYTANKKAGSLKEKKESNLEKPRFDWHDEFLEGMRIFGNIDEAEAYADEMKRKKTGKI